MNKDARITAYAVGELHGRDREKFEQEMASSNDLRREVDALSDLTVQLGAAPKIKERFTPSERRQLIRNCVLQHQSHRSANKVVKVMMWSGAGIAAVLIAFAGLMTLGPYFGPSPYSDGSYDHPSDNETLHNLEVKLAQLRQNQRILSKRADFGSNQVLQDEAEQIASRIEATKQQINALKKSIELEEQRPH